MFETKAFFFRQLWNSCEIPGELKQLYEFHRRLIPISMSIPVFRPNVCAHMYIGQECFERLPRNTRLRTINLVKSSISIDNELILQLIA